MVDYLIFMGFVLYAIVGICVWAWISEEFIDKFLHKDAIVAQGLFLMFGVIAVLASIPFLVQWIL